MNNFRSFVYVVVIGIVVLTSTFVVMAHVSSVHTLFFRDAVGDLVSSQKRAVDGAVMDFLRHRSDLPATVFSQREIDHMRDVRIIFDILGILLFGGIVYLFMFAHRSHTELRMRYMFLRALCIAMPVAIGMVAIFFEQIFVFMHTVLFTNDLWQLDPATSILIRVYDEFFFKEFAVIWFICSWLVLVMIAFYLRRHLEKQR